MFSKTPNKNNHFQFAFHLIPDKNTLNFLFHKYFQVIWKNIYLALMNIQIEVHNTITTLW